MNDEEIRRKIEVLNSKINKLSDAKKYTYDPIVKKKNIGIPKIYRHLLEMGI